MNHWLKGRRRYRREWEEAQQSQENVLKIIDKVCSTNTKDRKSHWMKLKDLRMEGKVNQNDRQIIKCNLSIRDGDVAVCNAAALILA